MMMKTQLILAAAGTLLLLGTTYAIVATVSRGAQLTSANAMENPINQTYR